MKGLSNEIRHKSAVFYVQTQDIGPASGYVESLIYKAGQLLTSRKSFYYSHLNSPDLQERVTNLMKEQHRAILGDIQTGRFDHFLSPSEPESGE
jgi:ubiquinone biosynthesis protein COQ9